MKLPFFASAALGLALAVPAFAQHITIGRPAALPSDATSDTLPTVTKSPKLEYPEEMRSSSTPGYAILLVAVPADGGPPMPRCFGSHVPFERTVTDSFHLWHFSPAVQKGQGGATAMWIPILFNPKSADPKSRDATPRLLSVTPAFTRERPKVMPGFPSAVPVKLQLDATGKIASSEPQLTISSRLRTAVEAALRDWQIAPARKDGNPVPSELLVQVVCVPPSIKSPPIGTPPRVIVSTQQPPEYPFAMRRFGLKGQVQVDFTVLPDGTVQNPIVSASNNPEFDAPALKAVRQWRFEPAMRDGKPVKTAMRVPVVFQLDGGGDDAFTIETQRDQSKLPAEMRYDTPAKIRNVQIAVYPYELLKNGVSGRAEVLMLIDRRGKVAQVKVTAADRPEFGLALAAAVEGFTFDPALKDGMPVPFLLKFEQKFSRFDLRDDSADELLSLEKKHPDRIAAANQLDAPLKPASRRPPIPPTAATAGNEGSAVIECIIDEEGHARLPRIVSATAPEYGYSAMQAANAWWFEPATHDGKPVPVRVRIPFRFTPKADHPAAKSRPGPSGDDAKPAPASATAPSPAKS